MANPFFSDERFSPQRNSSGGVMTVTGAANKSIILVGVTFASAMITFQHPLPFALLIGCAVVAFILSLVTSFKPSVSPITAPIYALTEGLTLGAISAMYAGKYTGIVLQAVMLTFGTLFSLLALYRMGVLRMSGGLARFLAVSTAGIALTYLLSWILSFFHVSVPFIHSSGTFGILFSVFVVVVAALGFIQDFAVIEEGARQEAPAYMEWYSAFGLLVSLVWLYLEILRLLAKLRSRD